MRPLRLFVLLVALALAVGTALATVPSTAAKAGPYTCNGVTTVFAVPFKFLDASHLVVTRALVGASSGAALTLTTDYTVTGVGAVAGGAVTLVAGSRCGSGYTLTITMSTPKTQTRNLRTSTSYRADKSAPIHHWITSFARSNSDCGIVSPSARTAFRSIGGHSRVDVWNGQATLRRYPTRVKQLGCHTARSFSHA